MVNINLAEIIWTILSVVGFYIMLWFAAFVIGWGFRRGQAKIPTQNNYDVNVQDKRE